MADIIRLARDRNVENSRKDAILFLDFQEHLVGQQWQVRYYRDESQTEIDTLVAIGVRNGTGSECYKVISYGTATPVISITETLPDVSELAHGELYIVKVEGQWNYVSLVDDTRFIDPITGGPYSFFNLEDGHVWYYNEHLPPSDTDKYRWLRRDDNFYSREELDTYINETDRHLHEIDEELAFDAVWLKDLDDVAFPIKLSVTASPTSTIWASGTSHDITFSFSASKILRYGLDETVPHPETESEYDVTSDCKFYYKLSTEASYHEVSGSSVTLPGITAANKTITYEFKGGNVEKFGRLRKIEDISYDFGYRFLYGTTSGTITNIDSLTASGLMLKQDSYLATFTTNLGNLATFAIPTAWDNITKITEEGGSLNYTSSFSKIGTFSRTIDGQSVSYNVWRWSSLPTVATNFIYRFYN
jgi:hypothetical protein